ncbi:DNA polymerase III subunit alpha [Acidihalobacter aeolianus]|uniref:DNA polymerase III subunit alpha n=1 Tax=Acidihalobacter aeolianus TaxID=2792603 RepID=A0A1D8K7D8_9GAMM|nr:DNA polymerase III subunit alpha [Acidihalobacter aeolianus]AOV16884.1 DNA polymerase III subunit alpha [Acidihalobacter aeolianus]
MEPTFVHLSLHTEYSLTDSVLRIGPLMKTLAGQGVPAVALTDQCNLFAMVKFYRTALRTGIKPIIGVDAWMRVSADYPGAEAEPPTRILFLCQNETGYRNLTRLVSRSYLEGQHGGLPMLEYAWLDGMTDGLIALSGGRTGDVGRALLAGREQQARTHLDFWRSRFPDRYYLELQRTGREGEERYIHDAVSLAIATDTPVVATNDVRFLSPDDFEAHEARVCIHDGDVLGDPRRVRRYSAQQYLRTPDEMCELFADLPEALENTVEIARRCSLKLEFGKSVLPQFPVPEGMDTDSFLRHQAEQGLERRLLQLIDAEAPDAEARRTAYAERLALELDVIVQMGFPGYFLIVADFIQWAKRNQIPVGPGRGSGAGSLVAYSLGITDLDPIRYDLLFERFLNPERVSMPDFDVDFCMEKRDRVIDYVAERYGRDRVSQIITYGSMAAKAVVRDVGRVLSHPYGFVDRIAKLIPFEIGMTLEKALAQEEDLQRAYQEEEEVTALIDLALKLEGLARNAGKHAGGVVIAPSPLTDFSPLYCEESGQGLVTQFDKDDVEAIGLVKFDFLGLRTLTIIDWAMETINKQRAEDAEPLDVNRLPLDDAATYGLLKRHQTTAVFQLESSGMQELIKRLQPDNFEDIVALVALYRPGPLQSGMVDDFINRKHGRAKVEYPHPDLEPILKPTYGVILYQEQVMQIAQVLADYTLGGADLLRRAMGKKKPEEMAKQREIFMRGAVERGVDANVATYIFDLMEKFAGYGFNKSHSAAYALLSYQTAWLKQHHPAAFMAAVLSADMDNTDKVVNLIEECRQLGLEVVPPDVNRSFHRFTALDERTILYGMGAIKGIGASAIEGLLEERENHGHYLSLEDLCRRVIGRKVNRRVLEALIRAGTLDALGLNRATHMARLPEAIRAAEQAQRDAEQGQNDLFGDAPVAAVTAELPTLPEWEEDERLHAEKETLGLYLTGHPIARFADELSRFVTRPISAWLQEDEPAERGRGARNDRDIIVAGLVVGLSVRTGPSGRFAFVTLDDRSGRLDVGLFGDEYQNYADLLAKDSLLVIEGSIGFDAFSGRRRVRAQHVYTIDQARARFAQALDIRIVNKGNLNGLAGELMQVLKPYCYREHGCPIWLSYRNRAADARLVLGDDWRVRPSDELLRRLSRLHGVTDLALRYGPDKR